jgi:anthranilate phosphoribosyltransferase
METKDFYNLFLNILNLKYSKTKIKEILLGIKDEDLSSELLEGAARAMLSKSLKVDFNNDTFDICGTGGSGNSKPFNISTASSIVLASQGVCIAKHGNRAVSSKSGSADVLESLGVKILLTPKNISKSLLKNNIAFLFSQVFHPAMKSLMPIRKEIAKKTIFNILGPLTNPSLPSRQVVGVSNKNNILPMIKSLKKLGRKSAMVLFGEDGLDDATLSGKTFFAKFSEENPEINEGFFYPEEFGLNSVLSNSIMSVQNSIESAKIIEDIFLNREKSSRRNIVIFNAGIGFYVSKFSSSIKDGINLARKSIESGDAYNILQKLRNVIN